METCSRVIGTCFQFRWTNGELIKRKVILIFDRRVKVDTVCGGRTGIYFDLVSEFNNTEE